MPFDVRDQIGAIGFSGGDDCGDAFRPENLFDVFGEMGLREDRCCRCEAAL